MSIKQKFSSVNIDFWLLELEVDLDIIMNLIL